MKFAIFLVGAYAGLAFGIYYGMEKSYDKGFYDGYHKYIGTFIPAPMLPREVPVKIRNRELLEKFKG